MRDLIDGELAIMEIFWERDTPLSSNEVKEAGVKGYKPASVPTIIRKLAKLGYLKSHEIFQQGNHFYQTYRYTISRDEYYAYIIAKTAKNHDAAFLGALPKLKEQGGISKETIQKLREMIDQWED